MAKNRIEIIITAASQGLQSGLRRAMGMVGDFVGDIKSIGAAGMAAFNALNQAVFFFVSNIQSAIQFAKGLYDIFLSQAVQAERLQVVLEHLTGSQEDAAAVMERIDQVSLDLGQDWGQVAQGGQQLAAAAKDAQGNFDIDLWEHLLMVTEDLSATRPDVPFSLMARGVTAAVAGDLSTLTRLLDVNVAQLAGLQEASDEILDTGGRLTGLVEIEADNLRATAQGGVDVLDRFLENYGAMGTAQDIAENTLIGSWGRIKAEFQAATREIGEKFLPIITDALNNLLDWWDEHEDDVMAIADAFAENLAGKLADIDWEAVAAGIGAIVKTITDLVTALGNLANSPAAQWLESTFSPEGGTIGAPGQQNFGVGRGGEPLIETIRGNQESRPTTQAARAAQRGNITVDGSWADKTIREVVEMISLEGMLDALSGGGG